MHKRVIGNINISNFVVKKKSCDEGVIKEFLPD